MSASTESNYQLLVKQAEALVNGESDWIANASNISALLFNSLNDVNFAGVYRYENNELILGPFQGKPACVHIAIGKGVCGTAAKEMYTNLQVILLVIAIQIPKLSFLFSIEMVLYGAYSTLIRPKLLILMN